MATEIVESQDETTEPVDQDDESDSEYEISTTRSRQKRIQV